MVYIKDAKPIKYKTNYSRDSEISISWSFNYYLKTFILGINYIFFVFLSVFMLLYSKKNDFYDKKVKNIIMKISIPEALIVKVVNVVFVTCGDVYYYIINTRNEILKLKSDNFLLRQQIMGYDYTIKENEQLKQVVNLTNVNTVKKYKTIRLDILNSNIYSNIISAPYGFDDDLHEGDFVIDTDGNLLGRIINLQKNNSEILLITDPLSKIVTKTEESKINMILFGNKTKFLDIGFIDGENYEIGRAHV